MPTVTIATANQVCAFECADGERVLHAGLRSGSALPYECASGTCGKCRATLVDGRVRELWPEAPGRAALKSAGDLLMCQSTVTGDVRLSLTRMQASGDSRDVIPGNRKAVVSARRKLTSEIVEVTLTLDEPLSFHAGQFVLLETPGIQGPRAYSMANYDAPADTLRFVVRRKTAGCFTDWVFADCVGKAVGVFGPLGKAFFDPRMQGDIVCIAGGSGIAGMLSIIRSALAHRHLDDHRLDLFFGVRTSRDLFYAEELAQLRQAAGSGFSATVAFSEETTDDTFAGRYPLLHFEHGLVHEVALRTRNRDLKDSTAFLAGPPIAVDAGVRSLLTTARVPLNRIRFDKYS
jgi:toluene monooxygenase electron transfer component